MNQCAKASRLTKKLFKVTVCGAGCTLGESVSLLLKQSPLISKLDLYDSKQNITGHILDLSAIETSCKVRGFVGLKCLPTALANTDLVVLINTEWDSQSEQEQLNCIGPEFVKIASVIAQACPQVLNPDNAITTVISTPVNILTMIVSEALKRFGVLDCGKVMGITSPHTSRANSLLAEQLKMDPELVAVPLIGGASLETIVPVFSQAQPHICLSQKCLKNLTQLIKNGDCHTRKFTGRLECMNKAFAIVRFIQSVLHGLAGEECITECALVRSVVIPGLMYFALPVILGPNGIKYTYDIPHLTPCEHDLLTKSVSLMKRDMKIAYCWLEKFLSCNKI